MQWLSHATVFRGKSLCPCPLLPSSHMASASRSTASADAGLRFCPRLPRAGRHALSNMCWRHVAVLHHDRGICLNYLAQSMAWQITMQLLRHGQLVIL